MSKLYVYGILFLIFAGFSAHYTYLIKSKAELKLDLKQTQQQVKDVTAAFELQQQVTALAAARSATANNIVRETDDLFSRHDFQRLLNAKQGLILRRVNNATLAAGELLECLSLNSAVRGEDSASCTH